MFNVHNFLCMKTSPTNRFTHLKAFHWTLMLYMHHCPFLEPLKVCSLHIFDVNTLDVITIVISISQNLTCMALVCIVDHNEKIVGFLLSHFWACAASYALAKMQGWVFSHFKG